MTTRILGATRAQRPTAGVVRDVQVLVVRDQVAEAERRTERAPSQDRPSRARPTPAAERWSELQSAAALS